MRRLRERQRYKMARRRVGARARVADEDAAGENMKKAHPQCATGVAACYVKHVSVMSPDARCAVRVVSDLSNVFREAKVSCLSEDRLILPV